MALPRYRFEQLEKRLESLKQLAGDQAMAIRILQKKLRDPTRKFLAGPNQRGT